MKCSIDNKPPRSATHLKTKAKKNALMEDRIDQIETENRILLQKMTHIMRVSSLVYRTIARIHFTPFLKCIFLSVIFSSARVQSRMSIKVKSMGTHSVKSDEKGSYKRLPIKTCKSWKEFNRPNQHTIIKSGKKKQRLMIASLQIYVNSNQTTLNTWIDVTIVVTSTTNFLWTTKIATSFWSQSDLE